MHQMQTSTGADCSSSHIQDARQKNEFALANSVSCLYIPALDKGELNATTSNSGTSEPGSERGWRWLPSTQNPIPASRFCADFRNCVLDVGDSAFFFCRNYARGRSSRLSCLNFFLQRRNVPCTRHSLCQCTSHPALQLPNEILEIQVPKTECLPPECNGTA